MKKLINLFLFVAFVTMANAQKVVNDANAQKRNVSGYHAIEVSDGIDLYLSQGDESVAVSASEIKFRDRIKTEVENGILKIYYEKNPNSNFHLDVEWGNRKLKAYVSYKDIDALSGSGGSDISVDGSIKVAKLSLVVSGGSDFDGRMDVTQLKVDASGGSDLKISGVVNSLDVEASGGCDFKGYDLAADICKLDASSGSDIYITVNKELTAEASGGSDVYYKGNGTVSGIRSSGSSNIKKTGR